MIAVQKVCSGGQWRPLYGAVRFPVRPAAPAVVGTVAGNTSVTVTWTAPRNTGGSPVLDYTVTVSTGAVLTVPATDRTVTVSGLPNGSPVTVSVTARNAQGSTASAVSAPVVPTGSPAVRPDVSNTGPLGVYEPSLGRNLAYSDLTTYAGPLTLTEPGDYYRLHFPGSVIIKADNIRLIQCRVQAVQYESALYTVSWVKVPATGKAPTGFEMIDTEVDGNGVPATAYAAEATPQPGWGWAQSSAVFPGWGWVARRSRFRRTLDFIKPQDNPPGTSGLVEDCLIAENCMVYNKYGPGHSDTVQMAGSGARNWILRRNTFDIYDPVRQPLPNRPPGEQVLWTYGNVSGVQCGSFPKVMIAAAAGPGVVMSGGTIQLTAPLAAPVPSSGTVKITRVDGVVVTYTYTGLGTTVYPRDTLTGVSSGGAVAAWKNTAVITFTVPTGVMENLLWEDNYHDGGLFAFRWDTRGGLAVCSNVVVRRSTFGLNHLYGVFTSSGTATDGGKPVVEPNSTWAASGVTPYGKTVLAGELVT